MTSCDKVQWASPIGKIRVPRMRVFECHKMWSQGRRCGFWVALQNSGISREDSGGIGQLRGGIEWILATSTLPGGVEQIWGGIANFLAVIFLLAAAPRAALFALGSSFLAVVAFAAGNALLLSAVCGIRYRRGPPTVRNMRAVLKKASCGTRLILRGIRC